MGGPIHYLELFIWRIHKREATCIRQGEATFCRQRLPFQKLPAIEPMPVLCRIDEQGQAAGVTVVTESPVFSLINWKSKMRPAAADKTNLLVVLVDLQAHFIDRVPRNVDAAIARIQQLLIVSDRFGVPVLATLEEPIARKGQLFGSLAAELPESAVVLPKLSYDLCEEPSIRKMVLESNRKQCAVVGAETDVCVLQSVLGLLRLGLDVFLVEDCVLTSSTDATAALSRMYACGAIPVSWKSLYYELLQTDDVDSHLRADEEMINRNFVSPEDLSD